MFLPCPKTKKKKSLHELIVKQINNNNPDHKNVPKKDNFLEKSRRRVTFVRMHGKRKRHPENPWAISRYFNAEKKLLPRYIQRIYIYIHVLYTGWRDVEWSESEGRKAVIRHFPKDHQKNARHTHLRGWLLPTYVCVCELEPRREWGLVGSNGCAAAPC